MAESIYFNANVEVTDTFATWVSKTNDMIYDMATIVMTTSPTSQPNTTNGGFVTGNSQLEGIFSANTIAVATNIRGGTVSAPSNLNVVSNTVFSASPLVSITNATANLHIAATSSTITSNTVTISNPAGNTTVNTAMVGINGATFRVSSTNTAIVSTTANITGTTLNVTSNTSIAAASLNADVGTFTIGSDASDVLNVNSTSDFNSNVNIDGILTATANAVFTGESFTVGGNTTIGDSTSDRLVVNAYLNSDLVPTSNTIDLGTNTNPYGNVHVDNVHTNTKVSLIDNAILAIGASDDLEIYHNGTKSIIENATGDLNIKSNTLSIQAFNGVTNFVSSNTTGAYLYSANSVKFETLSTGAKVTGALTVTGSSSVGGTSAVTGAATFANTVSVTGAATFANTVNITGTTSTQAISANGNVSVTGNFSSTGLVTITNTTDANSTVAGALSVLGGVTISKDLRVNANERIAGQLSVASNTFLESNLTVSGSATVDSNLATGGTLIVSGNTTLSSETSINTATANSMVITGGLTLTSGRIRSNVLPQTTNLYDIGSSSLKWRTVTANNFVGSVEWDYITNKPDPTITVTLSGEVTGSANTTLTDLTNGSITINTTIQPNTVALGTDTTGSYVAVISAGAGMAVSGSGVETASVTVSHSDTSSIANTSVVNSNGNVLQSLAITYDTFGHVLSTTPTSTDLDLRYTRSGYSRISIDGVHVNASSINDEFGVTSGSGISLTANTSAKSVSIASIDTLATVTSRSNTTTNSITVGGLTVNGGIIINGDLQVSGTTTIVNSTELDVGNSIISLNADLPSTEAPTEDAGIIINRGSSANVAILWNETTDSWTFGSTSVAANTFVGNLSGSASQVANGLTFSSAGSGAGSGTVYDGSIARTISYNSVGAPSVSGANATGTWGIGITGNAATATKLQTSKTIWGQSFDGSANISGALTGVTNITGSGDINITSSGEINLIPTSHIELSGSVGIGKVPTTTLDVAGNIGVNNNVRINSSTASTTTTTPTVIASFNSNIYRSGKYAVQVFEAAGNKIQNSELLVIHNTITASATEFAIVHSSVSPVATYEVNLNNGIVELIATSSTANLTQYRVFETLFLA